MTNKTTDNKTGGQPEMSELMAAFNSEPPKTEEPSRFYWETWQDAAHHAVQEAFEN